MHRTARVFLPIIALPFVLLQATLFGCLPNTGGGGGSTVFNLPPVVALTSDVQRGVAPLVVQFSSSGSTDDGVIVQRAWDFGDGSTSAEIAPTHIFTTTGDFTVRLTLTDDQGATSSRAIIIAVTERPIAVLKVDRSIAEAAPAQFNFDASASYDPDAKEDEELSYEWDFGDGTREVLATVPHTFATSGTFRVRLTVTDAVGVTGTAEKYIEVGIPKPTISIRSPRAELRNLVVPNDAPLFVHTVFSVQAGVPYTLRAGLDGDLDSCFSQVAIFDPTTNTLLRQLSDPSRVLAEQQGAVRAATYTPNGAAVLAGGDDGTARLYAMSGALERRYAGAGQPITSLAVSPDGSTFVTGYADGSLVHRDIGSGAVLRVLLAEHITPVWSVAFSTDGTQLLSGDNSGVAILWNLGTNSVILRYNHPAPVYSVAFSPTNAQRIATGCSDKYARLWSAVNGRLAQEFGPVFSNGAQIAGHTLAVRSVAFSPDGANLATGSEDKSIKIWRASTGAEVATLTRHTGAVNSVAYAPNGSQLISGSSDGTAIVWNLQTQQALYTLQPCVSPITAVQFAPDGLTVLAAVAAGNDIPLDTNPSSGNDLNLTQPTALDMTNIPSSLEGKPYFLWVEVRTDRSAPARVYSPTRIVVVPPFPSDISQLIPTVPLLSLADSATGAVQDVVNVSVGSSSRRQIFGLGQLDVGDRLFLSLLTSPGYTAAYSLRELNPLVIDDRTSAVTDPGFSLEIVDAEQKLYAWYGFERTFFSPQSVAVIGHTSANYLVVVDGTGGQPAPGVGVRITRQFAPNSDPRRLYVHLQFGLKNDLTVQGSAVFDLPAFDVPGRDFTANQTIRSAIVSRVQALFKDYNVVVSTTAPPPGTQPFVTIYFDVNQEMMFANLPDRNNDGFISYADLQFWGLPNYIDPRGDTRISHAVLNVGALLAQPVIDAMADAQLGTVIGNAAAHHAGLLLGLRETDQGLGNVSDIMTQYFMEVVNAGLVFTSAPLAAVNGFVPLGIQDSPQYLLEIVGPKP